MLDSLDKKTFQTMSDYDLWMYYDFNDSDMVHYDGPTNSARLIKYKFPHKGNYLVATQWYNKCLDQDTFFFTRISYDCTTSGVNTLIKSEPKLIGMFDMMGRPVSYARENEIVIYVYDDGSSRKIMNQR
jgi:hypothetical protein